MNGYRSVKSQAQAEFEEKRSQFISYIKPVKTEEEAQKFIAQIKAQNHDARHNVFAYILNGGMTERYSDDGEPQGTAGIPTLQVLKNEGLTDVAVVTTRYFGGILLGGGGLVRAYTKSARLAVDAAGIAEYLLHTVFSATYGYQFHSAFLRCLEKYGAALENSDYAQEITSLFSVLSNDAKPLEDAVFEASNGTVKCTFIENCYR